MARQALRGRQAGPAHLAGVDQGDLLEAGDGVFPPPRHAVPVSAATHPVRRREDAALPVEGDQVRGPAELCWRK